MSHINEKPGFYWGKAILPGHKAKPPYANVIIHICGARPYQRYYIWDYENGVTLDMDIYDVEIVEEFHRPPIWRESKIKGMKNGF